MKNIIKVLGMVAVLSSASIAEGVNVPTFEEVLKLKNEIDLLNKKLDLLRVETTNTLKSIIKSMNVQFETLAEITIKKDEVLTQHFKDLLNEHINFGTLSS